MKEKYIHLGKLLYYMVPLYSILTELITNISSSRLCKLLRSNYTTIFRRVAINHIINKVTLYAVYNDETEYEWQWCARWWHNNNKRQYDSRIV